jgi:hypothetical protein
MPLPILALFAHAAHAAITAGHAAKGMHGLAHLHTTLEGAHGAHAKNQVLQHFLKTQAHEMIGNEAKKAIIREMAKQLNLDSDFVERLCAIISNGDCSIGSFLQLVSSFIVQICKEDTKAGRIAASTGKPDRRYNSGKLYAKIQDMAAIVGAADEAEHEEEEAGCVTM